MKRMAGVILLLCLAMSLWGCAQDDSKNFMATVLENSGTLIVEPHKDTAEYTSSDKIVVHTEDAAILNSQQKEMEVSDILVGQILQITYNGVVAESYPAQIWADEIMIVN